MPKVLMTLPLISVMPPPLVVRLIRGSTPPTAPLNVVVPPVVTVSAALPSSLPSNLMFPDAPTPVDVSTIGVPVNTTSSV